MTETLTIEEPLPAAATVNAWLRESARLRYDAVSPTGPHVISIRDDVPANGQLFLSSHSRGYALVFKGDTEFINRWYNWATNCGVISANSSLNWFLEQGTGRIAYVCPQTHECVERGLIKQFSWEIIRDREIPLLRDTFDPETEEPLIEFDDRAIGVLAAARARAFMAEFITADTTILSRPKQIAPIYGLSDVGRAERDWATIED